MPFPDSGWRVERPFAFFGRGFVVLALVFAMLTPVVMADESLGSPGMFFLTGMGLSAALSFFVTGVGMLPEGTRAWVMRSLYWSHGIAWIGMAGVMGACLAGLRMDEFLLHPSVIGGVIEGVLLLLTTAGTAAFGFACYGWYWQLWGGGQG